MKKYIKIILLVLPLLFSNYYSFAQWSSEVHLVPNSALIKVNVLDTGTLWTLGYQGFQNLDTPYIAIRKPFGYHWTIRYYYDMDLPVNDSYNCLAALNDSTAFVGTQNGKVYMTTNEGINWTLKINAGSQAFVNDIKFSLSNKQFGYVFCDPPAGPGTDFKIYKTTDGGYNWFVMSPNFGTGYVGAAYSTCVTDSNHAWYGLYCYSGGCNSAKLTLTTNGGFNWLTTILPVNSQTFTSIAFKDDNLKGFSSYVNDGAQGTINLFKSTNGGNNWNIEQNFYTIGNSLISIKWVQGTTDWYFTSGPRNPLGFYIFKSSNDGITWDTMSRNNSWDQIISLDAVKSNDKIYGWAVSSNSYVYRLIDTAEVIGIGNNTNTFPSEYTLYQNYPNPFNPTTSIKFSLPKSSIVSMKVFDILGNEVAVLINNEFKQFGEYSLKFDGSDLASGVYFYRIEAGSFIQSKKMVLIK